MRANSALVIEPAQSWQRLQEAKEFFLEDLEEQYRENHQRFLEVLMLEERQRFLNVHPYKRCEQRVDQANGFYRRRLTTRMGVLDLKVPRSRSGRFQTQVLRRYKRRDRVVDEALKEVFLLGVSTRQAGRALAGLIEDAVSAATVSQISKALNKTVHQWHRRPLKDSLRYLLLDGVSVRIRLVGKVQKRVALCAYGIDEKGQRQLLDFLLVPSESESNWFSFLEALWRRGLHGQHLELITTDGHKGLAAALKRLWPQVRHQRCWVHKLRNLENKLKASQKGCLEEAKLLYQAAHQREALQRFRLWERRWAGSAPAAVACVAEDLEELFAFYEMPPEHWKRIRSTNVIERCFVELRRRIRTMCAFTTRDSCERILFSVFNRMNDYWTRHPLRAFTQNS